MDKPTFIYRDGMSSDKDYVAWLAEIKQRYRSSQIKAAVRVNSTMLEFYWSVGRDLVALRAEQRWGAGVVKQFSLDMRETFPNKTGFSYANAKDMKRWYLFYNEQVTKGRQLASLLEGEKKQQLAGQLEMPTIFGKVSWGQHIMIVSKSKSLDEALFYINKVVEEGWGRSNLEDKIANHLYEKQGSAISNFDPVLA